MTNDEIVWQDYEKLALKIAWSYSKQIGRYDSSYLPDDLQHELYFVFERAKKGFKPELNIKFSTYYVTLCKNHLYSLYTKVKTKNSAQYYSYDNEESENTFNVSADNLTPEELVLSQDNIKNAKAKLKSREAKFIFHCLTDTPGFVLDEFNKSVSQAEIGIDYGLRKKRPKHISMTVITNLTKVIFNSSTNDIKKATDEIKRLKIT